MQFVTAGKACWSGSAGRDIEVAAYGQDCRHAPMRLCEVVGRLRARSNKSRLITPDSLVTGIQSMIFY